MVNKILTIITVIILLWLGACTQSTEKSCCAKEEEKIESSLTDSSITSQSVFNLDSKWIKQNKDTIQLQDLANKTTIAAMVFTNCKSACPRIVADLQRIEKSFTKEELQQIQFLLISMDPERDTPERFTEFCKEYKLNNNWVCISSSEDATMELANVLNVKVKKLADGGFDHSNSIHLLDRKGNIVYQQNGLAQDPSEIIMKTKESITK